MTRMTQAALGVGCLAGGAPLQAAQWSFAPQVSLSADSDSNRYLDLESRTSQSGSVNPSAVLQWASDTSQLSVTPWLMWQQISDSRYPNAHSESLNGEYDCTGELGQLSLQGGVADYTALATEIPDTGIVAPGLNRRSRQAALTFTHMLTERRSLVLQLSWLDVGYYGANSALLNLVSGYKYASISVGEKFYLAPATALTVSAFDNQLITPLAIGNSRESGLRLDFQHSFTERTSLKAFAGASQQSLETVRRSDAGEFQGSLQAENSVGALGGFTLTLATLRGHLDLDYANLLQPYSAGVLAQRQSLTLSDTQALNEKLDVTLAAARIQNNHSAVLLGIDRAFYDTVTLGLEWQYAEHWYLRSEVGATRTQTTLYSSQPDQSVNEWRVALSLRWTPLPTVRTF